MEHQEEDSVQRAVNETKDLIKMLETTSVRRVNLQAGHFKIEIERDVTEAWSSPRSVTAAPLAERASPAEKDNLHRVLSPMVGTFYHAPSPGAKSFIEVGARIEKGQPIGIVEAMKVMNEIASDASGVIVEILVPDGHPVQYEQPLIAVNTTA